MPNHRQPIGALEALETRRLFSALLPDDRYEDNDAREAALPEVRAGERVEAVAADNDYYRLRLDGRGIEARLTGGAGRTQVQLMRADGRVLADGRTDHRSGGAARTLRVADAGPGEYLLFVYGEQGWRSDAYGLTWSGVAEPPEAPTPWPPAPLATTQPATVQPAPPTPGIPDRSNAHRHSPAAIVLDAAGTASRTATVAAPSAWFRVNPPAGAPLTVRLNRLGPDVRQDLDLEIYAAGSGRMLDGAWGNATVSETLDVSATDAAGGVLVHVYVDAPDAWDPRPQRYTLSLNASVSAATAPTAAAPGITGTALLDTDFDAQPLGRFGLDAARSAFPGAPYGTGINPGDARGDVRPDPRGGHELAARYPAGGVGAARSGVNFLTPLRGGAQPDAAELRYTVRVEPGFDFAKGGKLPGLVGGGENAVGGRRADGYNGWSARVMWGRDGILHQYVYHPDQPRRFGERFDWWRPDGTRARLIPGAEHQLRTEVRLNTPGRNDGRIRSWLDGVQVLDRAGLRFRDTHRLAIDHLYISTFHGGSNDTWAPSRDGVIAFDDFHVTALP